MGIKAILVINIHGQVRLNKFYTDIPTSDYERISRECYQLISKRTDSMCNFVEGDLPWGPDSKLIYRHYATLFFIFAVDTTESELGILDLIQVFVESLDKCFENVCELDLIFHIDKVHHILDEVVLNGNVLETSLKEIVKNVQTSNIYQKETKSLQQAKSTAIGRSTKK
jgi:AP-3 complex subunit sigma